MAANKIKVSTTHKRRTKPVRVRAMPRILHPFGGGYLRLTELTESKWKYKADQ